MSKSEPRIPFIKREEWTDGAIEVFTMMERDEAVREEARKNGSKMNMINVLAHHPRIAIPFLEMAKALFLINLSMRLREIAVLRLAHLSNCEYEWFQHVAIGKYAGLTDADIEAIRAGEPADDWSEIDGLVMEAVDELEKTDTISDGLWERLSKHFDRQLMFEFIFMISSYKMTAWILNAMAVPLDETPQGRPPVESPNSN
jgi:4-carboxymuconolactone decarboxylase